MTHKNKQQQKLQAKKQQGKEKSFLAAVLSKGYSYLVDQHFREKAN